jgi:hypothetical protein
LCSGEPSVTFALLPFPFFIAADGHRGDAGLAWRELQMVVGRTLWDFVIEVIQTPGLRTGFLAFLIILEIALIVLQILVSSGAVGFKLGIGGVEVVFRP